MFKFSKENIIGAKFNQWTAISIAGNSVLCQCKCGKRKMMYLSQINKSPTYQCLKCSRKRIIKKSFLPKINKSEFKIDWSLL